MVSHANTFGFTRASRPRNSIALIYDLEGFSRFFNQPDVQDYIPAFLNYISEAVSICLFGGVAYWHDNTKYPALSSTPIHEKFMGDGGLYIFTPPQGLVEFKENFPVALCNRLWNLRKNFDQIIEKCLEEVPVFEIPRRIRFGLARGTVYELNNAAGDSSEFIGYCINLASRLQSYCPELGFIASARLRIPADMVGDSGYRKVIATRIKGFSKELVLVDNQEYELLQPEVRDRLFQDIES